MQVQHLTVSLYYGQVDGLPSQIVRIVFGVISHYHCDCQLPIMTCFMVGGGNCGGDFAYEIAIAHMLLEWKYM